MPGQWAARPRVTWPDAKEAARVQIEPVDDTSTARIGLSYSSSSEGNNVLGPRSSPPGSRHGSFRRFVGEYNGGGVFTRLRPQAETEVISSPKAEAEAISSSMHGNDCRAQDASLRIRRRQRRSLAPA